MKNSNRNGLFLQSLALGGFLALLILGAIDVSADVGERLQAQRIIIANPSNYLSLIPSLQPGDTLSLEAGIYASSGLPLFNINGTAEQNIVITGPEIGAPAVIWGTSGKNTVRIDGSSYLLVKNLEIDSRDLGGNGVDFQGTAHDVVLENLFIHGVGSSQQIVGIASNHAPTWNIVIRACTISRAGTGMYLGNSDGNQPFVNGVIEHNLIVDTLGYNMQIKHQNPRPSVAGMPTARSRTIIRHNVFSKASNASVGDMARPNLLVGHFPLSGVGAYDVYEIYANFFYQNPSGEPLFQGEGNVAFYNNLLFNSVAPSNSYGALQIQPHNDRPREIRIFNNTVVANNRGIVVTGGYAQFQQKVIGNAVFSANPVSAADAQNNITDSYGNATLYLSNPFAPPGSMDFFPRVGKLSGPAMDTTAISSFSEWNKDFNGSTHNATMRGAYSGEGQNPGWLPKLEEKPFYAGDKEPPRAPTGMRISAN